MDTHIYIKKRKDVMFLMKAVQWYLVIVIILYLFGPWEWRTQNPVILYGFLFLSQLLLYLGFKSKVNSLNKRVTFIKQTSDDKYIIKYLKYAILINLIFVILYAIRTTGMTGFSISGLIEKINLGINSPLEQYQNKFDSQKFGGSLLTYTITILSPFLWPVLPLSMFYFKKINIINKVLVILTIFFECARWIAIGTNKGVIDVILTVISVLIIQRLQSAHMQHDEIKGNTKITKKIVLYLIIGILLFVGIWFFSNNIKDRVVENWSYMSILNNNTVINFNAPLMKIIPEDIQPILIYASSYLTQGYYGLSLALDKPFVPMFGVGNSVFLIENFNELLNVDLYQYTYQVRIANTGWDPFVNWHSLYMWFANDISFVGTLFLMFPLGIYFGAICHDSIANKDPIASALLCCFLILFFYLPCNNQIFSSPITFMAFWGLSLFWLIKDRYRKRYSNKGENSK